MMSKTGKILTYVAVVILTLFIIYPLYLMVIISVAPIQTTLQSYLPPQYPTQLSLANFYAAIYKIGLFVPLLRSLYIALFVGGLALLLGIPAAYGLSKLSVRTANLISTTLFLSNMLPALTIAIPISVTFIRIGVFLTNVTGHNIQLFDTVVGVGLAQELIVLPLTIFLILGAFQGLPPDLEYQARVDGAGITQTLFRILIPLSGGAIASAFLLSFMMSWDEFTFALILSPHPATLPITIYNNITRGPITETTAFALIVTIPVLVLTAILSRFLKAEYLSGGLVG